MIIHKINKVQLNFKNSSLILKNDTNQIFTYHKFISISLYQIKISQNLSRDAWTNIRDIIKACNPSHTSYDLRTTEYLLQRYTGVIHTRYLVYQNNCMCFAQYPDLILCQYYRETKYDAKRLSYKTFDYLPIIYQLQLH